MGKRDLDARRWAAGTWPGAAVLVGMRAGGVAALMLVLAAAVPAAGVRAQDGTAAEGTTQGTDLPEAMEAQVDALMAAIRIDDTIAILRDEGLDYGQSLEADMFPGAGGSGWSATVALIYDGDRMHEEFRTALTRELATQAADLGMITAFFQSDLGRRVVELEIEGRRSLLDDGVEEAAKVALERLRADGGPRLELLDRFVAVNDLVESNVSGALNANLAFYRGMQRGGAFGDEMTEDQMLSDVWAQEAEIRQSTSDWVYSYLNLAYGPLSDAELAAYTDFCETVAGQQVNAALFAAFDKVFTPISQALGVAVARQMQGQDI